MSQEEVLKDLKAIVIKKAIKEVMAHLLKRAPWLGAWGPVQWLATEAVTRLIKYLVEETILGVNLLIIDIYVDGEVAEVKDVIQRLKQAKTEEEVERLEDELVKVAKDLIRLRDNIRLPTKRESSR